MQRRAAASILTGILLATGSCEALLERDVEVIEKDPQFDSPRVTDLGVREGLQILLDDGYEVVVVGRGKIVLQELGYKGSVLKIRGDAGKRMRYCSPSLRQCVPIPKDS